MKNFAIQLVWFASIYIIVLTALCLTQLFLFHPVLMSMYLFGLGVALVMVFSALHEGAHKTTKKIKGWRDDHSKKSFLE